MPLVAPDDFTHPYTPYAIQTELMRHVFDAVEARKIAIVESPTGTGKSLSLICSTLTWLEENQARQSQSRLDELRQRLAGELTDEPKWVIDREVERQTREAQRAEAELEERIRAIKQRRIETKANAVHRRKRQKIVHADDEDATSSLDDDSHFAPDSYVEDIQAERDGILPEVRKMMKRIYKSDVPDESIEEPDVTKIVFASRTHSQLSQFVSEIKKTRFHNSRIITLSGRNHLCINDAVKKSAFSSEDLNEKCLDLQKKGAERCPYLPPVDEPERLDNFRDHAFSNVHTLEDLEDLGRTSKICPYYGSRKAIKQAQLVALPYQLVLQQASRMALGLTLQDHILVIDEAHALIDTILDSRTVSIDSGSAALALDCLQAYQTRFKNVLKGVNATYLAQLVALLSRFVEFATKWLADASKKDTFTQLMMTNELALALKMDNLPIRALDTWIRENKIARKASGYVLAVAEKLAEKQNTRALRTATTSSIYRLQSFFMCLAEPDKDGRILLSVSKDKRDHTMTAKYLLLNPEEAFRDVVEQSRSVILAGGTMAPIQDFKQQLFSYKKDADFSILSCGHVIPPENLLVRSLGTSPNGKPMEFTYDRRQDSIVMNDLGQTVLGIANVVQGGVVCFLPSYAFLDAVLPVWRASGLLSRLEKKRKVFTEPKLAADTATTLQSYADAVESGAILFAVIGAKLSEGINFSDSLCRCVIVVSIPFPSTQSVELKERMKFISELHHSQSASALDAGRLLYTTLAFRAVNQAIEQAAPFDTPKTGEKVLLDARYNRTSSTQMLPKWIANSLTHSPNFGALLKDLGAFKSGKTKK